MKRNLFIAFIIFGLCSQVHAQQVARATDVQMVSTAGTKLVFTGGITFKGTSNWVNNAETYLYKNTGVPTEGWLDSTAAGVLSTASTGNVFFNGAQLQSFYGKTRFYDLTVRNTIGTQILSSCEIRNLLHLDTGFVFTASGYGNDSFLVSNPATTAISSTSSYAKSWVKGRLSRAGNATAPSYLFPIGKDTLYAPVKMDKVNAAAAIWTAEYFPQRPYDYLNIMYPPVDHISQLEYWEINSDQLSGTNDWAVLSLSWRGYSQVSANALIRDSLIVSQYINRPPYVWDVPGGWVTGKTTGADSLFGYVMRSNQGGFADSSQRRFTLGTISKYNILPLRLIYFTAFPDANKVRLNWDVTNEQDTRYYEVEKSLSAVTFAHFSTVNSLQQNQSLYTDYDNAPAQGWNYYRLKIFDKQGKFTYSPVRAVNFSGGIADIKIFPNPTTDVLNIQLPSSYTDNTTLQLISIDGKMISTLRSSSSNIKLNVAALPSGTYVMLIIKKDGTSNNYKFVKQ